MVAVRVQAYVGAFLRRSTEKSGVHNILSKDDPASHLYDVGTFAQVSFEVYPGISCATSYLSTRSQMLVLLGTHDSSCRGSGHDTFNAAGSQENSQKSDSKDGRKSKSCDW